MSWKWGYARVSTGGQDLGIQRDALIKAGCPEENVFEEKASGAKRDRDVLADLLSRIREGDTLMVWKFDRLARSALHLIQIAEELKAKKAHLVSITDKIDTSSPMGEAMFQICGVMAQLERRLIEERREAGLNKARASGVKFGRKSLDDPASTAGKSGNLAKALLAVQSGTMSQSAAAREYKVSRSTIMRHMKKFSAGVLEQSLSSGLKTQKTARNGVGNGLNGHCFTMT